MPVEVGMNLEAPAALDLVKAAAFEMRVGDKSVDAGQALKEADECSPVELVEEVAREGWHPRLIEQREFLAVLVLELTPDWVIRPGELIEDTLQHFRGKQIVDDCVRERFR